LMCSDGPELPSFGSTHPSPTGYGLVALNIFQIRRQPQHRGPLSFIAILVKDRGSGSFKWPSCEFFIVWYWYAFSCQKWLIILHSCSCAPPPTRLMAFGWSLLQDRLCLAWVAAAAASFILDFRVIKLGSWWISHFLGIWRRH
jgi:hypothetical protein